jgi:hypothetical protein
MSVRQLPDEAKRNLSGQKKPIDQAITGCDGAKVLDRFAPHTPGCSLKPLKRLHRPLLDTNSSLRMVLPLIFYAGAE